LLIAHGKHPIIYRPLFDPRVYLYSQPITLHASNN
jgi:hypothetical protein